MVELISHNIALSRSILWGLHGVYMPVYIATHDLYLSAKIDEWRQIIDGILEGGM